MMKFITTLAVLLASATPIALVLCAPTIAAGAVAVTEAQNGKTITIEQGAPLVITLESNPSTGYGWQVSKNDEAILKMHSAPTFRPAAHEMPGAPGHQSFRFVAISTGSDTIDLEYRRPWETSVTPAKTFSIIVTVK